MGFRPGLVCRLLMIAAAIVCACPRAEAAASATYRLTDLGAIDTSGAAPGFSGYTGEQVDDSGSVHIVHNMPAINAAGPYQFQTLADQATDVGGNTPLGEYERTALLTQTGTSLHTTIIPPAGLSPVDQQTYAAGVNASGTAVGWADAGPTLPNYDTSLRTHTAFVYRPDGSTGWSNATPSVIPGAYPGSVASFALGINSSGMIVGQTPAPGVAIGSNDTFRVGRAMISDGTTTTDLNTLIAPGSGFLLTSATSINDLGQIAGYATHLADDTTHSYLLTPTPTPEPTSLALFALAATGLGLRRWARGRATPGA